MAGEAFERLYDAALTRDLTTFQQLLQQDPHLLNRVSYAYCPNTTPPLHMATLQGNLGVMKEVLKINPKLAQQLDCQKSSPLHIAAAQGHRQIAYRLLSAAPKMCWRRDCHGMNPIHIAAMNGHVEILEALIGVAPIPAREKVDGGQTVLHLCVKHGQRKALELLVQILGDHLISAEDDEGDTILHLAVRCYKTEGVGRFVRWLEQESAKQEDEKSQYSEQLKAARAKLGKANTEVKALKADLAAQRARAAEEAEEARTEMGRLRAELRAAKGELRAAKDGQDEVLWVYTKRLLLSDQFTELARDLAGLINGNATLEAIEEVAKDYPGLDASKYGYQRLEGAAVYTQYAEVVRRHLGRLPLLNELASSSALLTAEMVAACSTDRDSDLDAAFDALPEREDDVEMEEAGARAGEEKADGELSSSKAVENPTAVEADGAGEGASAGKAPTPEKEVGDP